MSYLNDTNVSISVRGQLITEPDTITTETGKRLCSATIRTQVKGVKFWDMKLLTFGPAAKTLSRLANGAWLSVYGDLRRNMGTYTETNPLSGWAIVGLTMMSAEQPSKIPTLETSPADPEPPRLKKQPTPTPDESFDEINGNSLDYEPKPARSAPRRIYRSRPQIPRR